SPESPSTADQHCGPSDMGANRPGHLVDTSGPQTRARVARDSWSTPRDHRPVPESTGTACQHSGASDPSGSHPGPLFFHRGPSDTGLSRPGQQVDPMVPGTQA
ncbi:hypothetical protein C0215_19820, partial [Clostridioides difficile]